MQRQKKPQLADAAIAKPSAAENSSRGKTEGGNKADAQKARAEIDTLRKTISGLQIEIEELKKKLKDKGTTTGSAGTVGPDNEQMKKLEEEKKKSGIQVEQPAGSAEKPEITKGTTDGKEL